MAILLEELLLPDAAAWRAWLYEHHDSHPGVRLVLHNKGGTTTELTHAQAVDEALCFGWIDGQGSRRDEQSHFNRFTPRAARSKWSARNVANIERLAGLGLMAPAGIAAVDAALAGHPLAQEKLETLGATERYAIYYRLHTVKGAETRRKKIAGYIARLDAGQGIV